MLQEIVRKLRPKHTSDFEPHEKKKKKKKKMEEKTNKIRKKKVNEIEIEIENQGKTWKNT